jgi:hypothetical protein
MYKKGTETMPKVARYQSGESLCLTSSLELAVFPRARFFLGEIVTFILQRE